MNKPKAPKKPRKNDIPPSPIKKVSYLVCEGYLYPTAKAMIQESELENYEGDHYDYLEEKGERCWIDEKFYGDKISYKDILWISKILNSEDFEIDCNFDNDRLLQGWFVTLEEANPNYEKELEDYNNRFELYEIKREKYEKNLDEYNKWKESKKIKKLEKELSQLKS